MSKLKKLTVAASEDTARRIVELLSHGAGPGAETGAGSAADAVAVTMFERGDGGWAVDAYYARETALDDIEPLLRAALGATAVFTPPAINAIPDEDWAAKVQRDLKPVVAGRFIVHGSHDRVQVGGHRFAIEIDAGEAFGTAHHGSTAGCLAALHRLANKRQFASVLDLGCGSGVLAIAAAKLWPRAEVVGSDIDPIATRVAKENTKLNRTGARVRIVTAAGFEHPWLRQPQSFDLVIANILAQPLQALAPTIARALRPSGVTMLSGLLDWQAREVLAAYLPAGMVRTARFDREGWSTLVLTKR